MPARRRRGRRKSRCVPATSSLVETSSKRTARCSRTSAMNQAPGVRRHRRHRAVEPEPRAAARRYEAAVPGLGSDFLDEVEAAIDAIVDRPRAWTRIAGIAEELEVRRFVLDRFPYYIAFLDDERGEVFVLAVAHGKRRPLFWARRAPPKKPRRKK